MPALTRDWQGKRKDLRGLREALHAEFEKSPDDLSLALKLKAIDDEIAECTEHLVQEKRLGSPGGS